MTREERIRNAVERYLTNQAKHGKPGRKWKAVKLFSVDGEDQRETRKGDLLRAKGE